MTTCFLAQLSTLFSLWPFIARQELCQTSQLTFLHPLHAFPLHLLPLHSPVVGFPFPTRCQVSACKGHQTLNLILPYQVTSWFSFISQDSFSVFDTLLSFYLVFDDVEVLTIFLFPSLCFLTLPRYFSWFYSPATSVHIN